LQLPIRLAPGTQYVHSNWSPDKSKGRFLSSILRTIRLSEHDEIRSLVITDSSTYHSDLERLGCQPIMILYDRTVLGRFRHWSTRVLSPQIVHEVLGTNFRVGHDKNPPCGSGAKT
jgi:hypothetical protein